jgi:hypothetical protein
VESVNPVVSVLPAEPNEISIVSRLLKKACVLDLCVMFEVIYIHGNRSINCKFIGM